MCKPKSWQKPEKTVILAALRRDIEISKNWNGSYIFKIKIELA